MKRESPVILVVAPTGSRGTKKDYRTLPTEPSEIAGDVLKCSQAGASIAHLHARDQEGLPTVRAAVYQEIIQLIRDGSNILIQISSGGATIAEIYDLLAVGADMISFDVRRLTGSDETVRRQGEGLLKTMKEEGIKPELEIFDEDCLRLLYGLQRKECVVQPLYCNLVLPPVKDSKDFLENLFILHRWVSLLPQGSIWTCCRGNYALRTASVLIGGNIREGIEDAVAEGGTPPRTNLEYLEEARQRVSRLGFKPASIEETRHFLGADKG